MNDARTVVRHTFVLGRLFGIRVGVHVSWLAAYALAVFGLAGTIDGFGPRTTLGLAALCGLLLFASVLAHEFAHALVARRFGVRTSGITLFLFGGVAVLETEPPSPRADALIALAGPALSALLAGASFALLAVLERAAGAANAAALLAGYLALANAALALFNLIPAFPLDGGRVLRAAIWRFRRNQAAATGAAAIGGLILAGVLVAAGAFAVLRMHAWGDSWYILIGAFLLHVGYAQLRDSRGLERLEHVRVVDVMDAAGNDEMPIGELSLSSSASALEAVSAFRRSTQTRIAVVDDGHLAGWLRRERTLRMIDRAA